MQLEKFVLLGHSMGGFLAASYAIQYPERVKHLILADPWGFPEKPSTDVTRAHVPLWVKAIAYVVQPLNPLWAVRFAGPFGQSTQLEIYCVFYLLFLIKTIFNLQFNNSFVHNRTMAHRNNKARLS